MRANDVALKIRDNNWFITDDNKILCSICGAKKDVDTNEVVDDSTAWHRKGIELGKLGRHDEALQAIDKALELNPDVSNAWYNRGIIFDNLGRYEEALQAYDKDLELNEKEYDDCHINGGTLNNLVR